MLVVSGIIQLTKMWLKTLNYFSRNRDRVKSRHTDSLNRIVQMNVVSTKRTIYLHGTFDMALELELCTKCDCNTLGLHWLVLNVMQWFDEIVEASHSYSERKMTIVRTYANRFIITSLSNHCSTTTKSNRTAFYVLVRTYDDNIN